MMKIQPYQWCRSWGKVSTVWPQAKKCPSETVARAGNEPQPAAAVGTCLDW